MWNLNKQTWYCEIHASILHFESSYADLLDANRSYLQWQKITLVIIVTDLMTTSLSVRTLNPMMVQSNSPNSNIDLKAQIVSLAKKFQLLSFN
jgi:hypothetical protein